MAGDCHRLQQCTANHPLGLLIEIREVVALHGWSWADARPSAPATELVPVGMSGPVPAIIPRPPRVRWLAPLPHACGARFAVRSESPRNAAASGVRQNPSLRCCPNGTTRTLRSAPAP